MLDETVRWARGAWKAYWTRPSWKMGWSDEVVALSEMKPVSSCAIGRASERLESACSHAYTHRRDWKDIGSRFDWLESTSSSSSSSFAASLTTRLRGRGLPL